MYWEHIYQIQRDRQKLLTELKEKVNKVINHRSSSALDLKNHLEVRNYVLNRFPSIDISHIKIFYTSVKALKSVGFSGMAGCYIDDEKVIFVLDQKNLDQPVKGKGLFQKMVYRATEAKLKVDDVLVHELLHAISGAMQRPTKPFKNAEEEFVYTHCLDFYRSRGETDSTIIQAQFLPFCLNDVLSDHEEMSSIFYELNQQKPLAKLPLRDTFLAGEYSRFLDLHAEFLVPKIIEKAKAYAQHMIYCYGKYGCNSASADEVNYDTSLRFQGLFNAYL